MDVKSGYGRNFLLPGGKAIPATDENLKTYEAEKSKLLEAEEVKIAAATVIFEKLNEFSLSLEVAVTEEGAMFCIFKKI